MATDSKTSSGGIGFCGLLTIVFIVMKLCHFGDVAQWSWLWVLSPLWIPMAIVFIVCALVMFFVFIGYLIDEISNRAQKRKRKKLLEAIDEIVKESKKTQK